MKIEIADINSIKPYENNPRKLSDKAIETVAMSLKEYGFRQPIVVDKDRIIVVGHTRFRASKKLGFKEVPITIADNLTPEQINAYRIADNRTSEESEWDNELLKMELKELDLKDFNLELTGFNEDQLNSLLFEEKQGLTDEDAVPETPEEPITKLGDIWKLGNHRVMCGDSTMIDDVEKLIKGEKADMLYTDPPYGIKIVTNNQIGGGGAFGTGKAAKAKGKVIAANKYNEIIGDESIDVALGMIQIKHILSCNTEIIWGGNYYANHLDNSNCWIVWDKETGASTFADAELAWTNQETKVRCFKHRWSGMVKASEHGQKRVHPTQKPIALAEWCFDTYNKPKSVIDLFLGSGSTLIACEKTKRKCYGMELDPKYCDVIVKRWEQFTGLKAELENGQN
jgi:DNA modification methylase